MGVKIAAKKVFLKKMQKNEKKNAKKFGNPKNSRTFAP